MHKELCFVRLVVFVSGDMPNALCSMPRAPELAMGR
jgi:hypothetical protein